MTWKKNEKLCLLQNLYIHFPFCETKCHYCDFFSLPDKSVAEPQQKHIYSSIKDELLLHPTLHLNTVFLGGGTPSLASIETLREIFNQININDSAEITIECNPSSIDKQKIKEWKQLGINRASMGMQALEDDRLKWLGRVHDKHEIFDALDAFFELGMPEISVDYILGVPQQSPKTIEVELHQLLSRYPKINHLSAYLLTLKKSNPLFPTLPHEEEQLEHLRAATRVLKSYGFEQYEVSNFSRNGKYAQHNKNYWSAGGYLGIGPSAHSYWPDQKKRTKNWASLGKYVELVSQKQSPVEWEEILTPEEERIEYLMLGLRKAEGVLLSDYEKRYQENLCQNRSYWIDQFLEKNLCKITTSLEGNKRLQLTEEGFYLSDQIISKII